MDGTLRSNGTNCTTFEQAGNHSLSCRGRGSPNFPGFPPRFAPRKKRTAPWYRIAILNYYFDSQNSEKLYATLRVLFISIKCTYIYYDESIQRTITYIWVIHPISLTFAAVEKVNSTLTVLFLEHFSSIRQ